MLEILAWDMYMHKKYDGIKPVNWTKPSSLDNWVYEGRRLVKHQWVGPNPPLLITGCMKVEG
jgi:hypothetical protein